MTNDISTNEERRGSRRLMLSGAIIAAILLVAVVAWPLVFSDKLGTPAGGASPAHGPDLTAGRGAPAQRAAESTVGKSDPPARRTRPADAPATSSKVRTRCNSPTINVSR